MQYAEVHTSTVRGQDYTAKFETRWKKEDSLTVIHPKGPQPLEIETIKIHVLLDFMVQKRRKKIPNVAIEYEGNDPSSGNILL